MDKRIGTKNLKIQNYKGYVARWQAMLAVNPKVTKKEACEQLGINYRTLMTAIETGTEQGWLKFHDPFERLEHQIVPKAVDVINHHLDLKDKTVALETAKGVIFPVMREAMGIRDTASLVLGIKIDVGPQGKQEIVEGQVIGTPRQIAGNSHDE